MGYVWQTAVYISCQNIKDKELTLKLSFSLSSGNGKWEEVCGWDQSRALRQAWEIVRPEPRHSRGRISEFRLIPSASNFSFLISRIGSQRHPIRSCYMPSQPLYLCPGKLSLKEINPGQPAFNLPTPIHSSRHVYTYSLTSRKLYLTVMALHLSLLTHIHTETKTNCGSSLKGTVLATVGARKTWFYLLGAHRFQWDEAAKIVMIEQRGTRG